MNKKLIYNRKILTFKIIEYSKPNSMRKNIILSSFNVSFNSDYAKLFDSSFSSNIEWISYFSMDYEIDFLLNSNSYSWKFYYKSCNKIYNLSERFYLLATNDSEAKSKIYIIKKKISKLPVLVIRLNPYSINFYYCNLS